MVVLASIVDRFAEVMVCSAPNFAGVAVGEGLGDGDGDGEAFGEGEAVGDGVADGEGVVAAKR